MKILLLILNWIAAAVLYIVIVSVATYLLNEEIVKLKYTWIEYIYYFGIGILAYYPCNYILKENLKTKPNAN